MAHCSKIGIYTAGILAVQCLTAVLNGYSQHSLIEVCVATGFSHCLEASKS